MRTSEANQIRFFYDNETSAGLLTANAVSVTNGMGVSGSATFGGPAVDRSNLAVNWILTAPMLKFRGITANDKLVIQNNLGSEVARFHNVSSWPE